MPSPLRGEGWVGVRGTAGFEEKLNRIALSLQGVGAASPPPRPSPLKGEGGEERQSSGAIRTSCLPRFLPDSMPMKAAGAFSSPSAMVSR